MSSVNQISCQFAEQLIDYLYGESDRHEKIRFEAHLKSCSSCAEEIAAFQTVRSSVADWRAAEFSDLTQPTIDVAAITGVSSPAVKESALSGWRKFFSFNPAFAAVAAVVIVCAGIAFFAVKFSGNQEVAQIGNEKNTLRPIVAPTAENTNKAESKIAETQKPDGKNAPPKREIINAADEPERKNAPVKTAVKVSDSPKAEPVVRRTKDETNKKTAPAKKQSLPNLNDLEDENDDSIRLADLFAELDTK